MPLIQLVGVLIVVGVLLWLVNNYIPMQGEGRRAEQENYCDIQRADRDSGRG